MRVKLDTGPADCMIYKYLLECDLGSSAAGGQRAARRRRRAARAVSCTRLLSGVTSGRGQRTQGRR